METCYLMYFVRDQHIFMWVELNDGEPTFSINHTAALIKAVSMISRENHMHKRCISYILYIVSYIIFLRNY